MSARTGDVVRVTLVCLAGLCVAACQSTPSSPDEAVRSATAEDTEQLHTELVRQMIRQEKYYAASAHLDALALKHGETGEIRLLRADCHRHLGQRDRAEVLYKSLLDGPYAADAAHGMGLLMAEIDLTRSIDYLQRAVRLQPTEARIRNDLGYAMMLVGRPSAALEQLATAVELAPEDARPRHNLVLLHYTMGDRARAERVADQGALSEAERDRLRRRAADFVARRLPDRTNR